MHYLHIKNLHSHAITPTSEIVMPLVAIMFADNTNLHVLNSGLGKIKDMVDKAQRSLEA